MFRWNVPFALLCFTLVLVGCQATGTTDENGAISIPNLNPFVAAEGQAATTDVPTAIPPVAQSSGTQGNEDVWRFTFPTPGPEPVSLWRPPLYPAPWALGPFDHFYFSRPIAADEVNWPLADYRYGGIFFGVDIVHTGVDITAPRGTPVLAAGPGKVVWAGYGLYLGNNNPGDPYGLAVTIRHDFGYQGHAI
ncbi:MAG: M23 family metallopeptidase [Chloroflexi bacterium]|nr:M23 family metallopeptidase [Chloroflexota bacterium]